MKFFQKNFSQKKTNKQTDNQNYNKIKKREHKVVKSSQE